MGSIGTPAWHLVALRINPRALVQPIADSGSCARLLNLMDAETAISDPSGLPLPGDAPAEHPEVQELRDLVLWSEGQVWCSPERHGSMSAVDTLGHGRGSSLARQDPGRDAGMWRLAVIHYGEPASGAGPLDAHGHNPEAILDTQGRSWSSMRLGA